MDERPDKVSRPSARMALRRLYKRHVAADPIEQFTRWFEEALQSGVRDPNAMVLATSPSDGFPSARMVYLRDYGPRGFVFFTGVRTCKGQHLEDNPRASLLFYWGQLERQIRVEGDVTRLPREDSEAYFRTRPRDFQIEAWLHDAEEVAEGEEDASRRLAALVARFEGRDVPMPDGWGGFLVSPQRVEFWQGLRNRLHDRLRYTLAEGTWRIERLYP